MQNLDFGFNTEEFLLPSTPYAQFINASDTKFSIGITSTNAELAKFELIDTWQPVEHEFRDGTPETLLLTKSPRLLMLNRSQAMMSNDTETLPYDKKKHDAEGYKAFSYVVVWFLDNNNPSLNYLFGLDVVATVVLLFSSVMLTTTLTIPSVNGSSQLINLSLAIAL
jgi:hypothetical protein